MEHDSLRYPPLKPQLSPVLCFPDSPLLLPSSDDFSVDELLDFSNHDACLQLSDEGRLHDHSLSVSGGQELLQASLASDPSSSFPGLDISAEELANLEWLSNFVEDSFSGFSAPFPSAGISSSQDAAATAAVEQPESDDSVSLPELCFKTSVPVKARSKRTRTGGRVWCLASPSMTESSSSSSTSSTFSSPASSLFLLSDRFEPEILVKKKPKKKPPSEKSITVVTRRCSHCGVQKTPQWRTGPLGPKTLCNACGVRYKSGRLLPEYRPACSPTFSTELHSNHHRKVIEMRRKKETIAPPEF